MNNNQKSAFYSGVKFVDIDREIDLPTDYDCDRIPNKGDVMCFSSVIGNDTTYHHCVVLYIYDSRQGLSKPIDEMEIFNTSIYVVTRKINPQLGDETWKSVEKLLNRENNLNTLI